MSKSGPRTKTKPKPSRSRFRSSRITTHPSFYVSLLAGLFCAVTLVGLALAVIQEASTSGNTRRWNIVIIVGLLAGTAFYSLVVIVGRVIAVKAVFRSMPKPYIPNKSIDVPKDVANHIMVEYTRTAVVAYLSQPTAGKQEGWGRPGTALANVHFRSRIKAMYTTLLLALDSHCDHPTFPGPRHPSHPPLSPLHLLNHPYLPPTSLPFMQIFIKQLELARYARREPDEAEVEGALKVVALILGMVQSTPLIVVERPKREEDGKGKEEEGLKMDVEGVGMGFGSIRTKDSYGESSLPRSRRFSLRAPPSIFATP